jgi:AcrR family transcriptional regulator
MTSTHSISGVHVPRHDAHPRPASQSEAHRVLDAAAAVLARTSWRDFKVQAVLREARVPLRTFYRDFTGKSELLVVLLEGEIAPFSARLSTDMAACATPTDRLTLWIERSIEVGFAATTGRRAKMFARTAEALRDDFPVEVTRARRLVIDPLRDAIAEGAQGGDFPHARPEEDAVAIWLLTSSLLRDSSAGSLHAMTQKEATDFVVRFALLAMRGPAAQPY